MTGSPSPGSAELARRLARLTPRQRDRLRTALGTGPAAAPTPPEASATQFGIWMHEQTRPGGSTYNNPAAVRLRGPLDAAALRTAMAAVSARHAPLRSSYDSDEDGALLARVDPPAPDRLPWREADTSADADPWGAAAELVESAAHEPFDLVTGPVWRGLLVRCGPDEHLLLLCFHHIVSDGGSLGVVFDELRTFYHAAVHGDPAPAAPAPPEDYFALVARRRRGDAATGPGGDLAYWTERLADAPDNVLLDHADEPPDAEAAEGSLPLEVPDGLAPRLASRCARHHTGIFAGFLTAFAVLLHRETGLRDLVLTTPVDTRGADGARLVGCFVNTVVLRVPVGPDDTLERLLETASRALAEALDHSMLPYPLVLEALDRLRGRDRPPFTAVSLVHNNAPFADLAWGDLRVSSHPVSVRQVRHDLALSVSRVGPAVVGRIEYGGPVTRSAARRLRGEWSRLLGLLTDSPELTVAAACTALEET